MKRNKFALQISILVLIVSSFIACDKDFATLESDIINNNNATNFNIKKDSFNIITYTKTLEPVQTNGLGLSTLGIYDDSYGRLTAGFVVQPTLSTVDPDFGDEVEIDSVVLTIPFPSNVTEIDEEGNITYDIDSVIGRAPIKLSIFESNYFIRDFDPNGDFNDEQIYFSNKTASSTESITGLEEQQLSVISNPENDDKVSLNSQGNVRINETGYILTEPDDEDSENEVVLRQAPAVRLLLETAYWQNKIIDRQGESVLASANNFSEYFRGLYFKAEPNDDNDGSFMILNAGSLNANIVIYYTRLTPSITDAEDARENATYAINFGGNSINFLDKDYDINITEPNPDDGESRIFLKGGEGAVGRIKLFDGENEDDNPEVNAFEDFRNKFVIIEDGKFIRSKRLVNEANLVFYVDQDAVEGGEPDRIYLYDVDNKRPLVDYFLDGVNNILPLFSIATHLEPLERVDDEPNGNGIKYKLRITEHINNLLVRDSTNIELGLSVSLNVNLEESIPQRQVQTSDNSDLTVPISSVISPRGTVLHGNNTEDESKKVYLEIYYTCLEEDDCEEN